jgi:hypothetical protein
MPWLAALPWGAIIGAAGSVAGGLLSNKGDNNGVTVVGPGLQAKAYWLRQLEEAQGLQSGTTQPTDLPIYKQMASQYNAQSDKGLDQLIQTLAQRGITAGGAGGAIGSAELAQKQGILNLIQSMYKRADERGNIAAGQLGSKSKQQLPQPGTGPMPDMTGLYKGLYTMLNNNPPNAGISPNAGSGVAGVDYGTGGYGNWMPPSGSTWG